MKKEILEALQKLNLNLIPCVVKSKMPSIAWKGYQTKKYNGPIPVIGNAAVLCGRIEGCEPLMVLDLDDPELANTLFDDWERVLRENLVVQTGSGGYHIYVKPRPEDSTQGKRLTNVKGQHMDIQGDGTYVIAPSSIHPNGNEYKIISSTTNIKEVNMTGFINSLSKYGFNTGGSGLPSIDEIAKGVQAGMINNSAFKYSCHLLSRVGLDKETAWYELKEWLKRCTTKHPDEGKLRSVFDHAVQRVERDGIEVNKDMKLDEEKIPDLKSQTEWTEWLSKYIGNNEAVDDLNKKFVLNIDNKILKHMIKKYPASFIDLVKMCLSDYSLDLRVELTMDTNTSIKDIRPEVGNSILCFEAEVMAVEERQTYTKSALFKCPNCDATQQLNCNEYHIIPTERCHCKKKSILGIVENDNIETDFIQNIYIRESMDEARHGSPLAFKCRLFGDIVGETYVGQRKRIIGQLRSLPTGKRNTNEVVIDVLSITSLDEMEITMPTDEELKEWKERVKDPNFFDSLANTDFAPDVIGHSDIRKSLLLSMAGSPKTQHRINNIHILLLGDPGTAKTTLIERVDEAAYKSVMTGGKGNSAAGLTGGMDRIAPNMPFVFLPGVMTLVNKGIALIDEIDKMRDHDQDSLLIGMSKGYIPINKVGVHGILPADTTIIATANPKGGRQWISGRGITEQTNLKTPLLSRFDVIWLVRDDVDEYTDTRLSKHIVAQMNPHHEKLQNAEKIMRYMNYVKTLNPELTEEAQNKITEFYVRLRKLSVEKETIPIDPRKTEALAKLAMAHARLLMKEKADESDVKIALSLMESALNSFGTSMEEGKSQSFIIDEKKLNKEDTIWNCIKEITDDSGNFTLETLVEKLSNTKFFDEEQAKKVIRSWEKGSRILSNGDGTFRT